MADIIVQHALGQTGFDRYKHLLAQLFSELAGLELTAIRRSEAPKALLDECVDLQKLRNNIIHQGAICDSTQADRGQQASVAVYDLIVLPMLTEIGGLMVTRGRIVPKQ